jgi:hypothetical protein
LNEFTVELRSKWMTNIRTIIKQIESRPGSTSAVVHKLLELCMTLTDIGEISDDYTGTISFPIGGCTVISDSYYGRITVFDTDVCEIEIEKIEQLQDLIEELKKRLFSYDRKVRIKRGELTKEIFDKPLDNKIFGN